MEDLIPQCAREAAKHLSPMDLLALVSPCAGDKDKGVEYLAETIIEHFTPLRADLDALNDWKLQAKAGLDQQHARCEELADIAEKAAKLGKAVTAERDAQAARVKELEADLDALQARAERAEAVVAFIREHHRIEAPRVTMPGNVKRATGPAVCRYCLSSIPRHSSDCPVPIALAAPSASPTNGEREGGK